MGHDARKEVDFLHQVLEQDKRPFAFLLGAGCPLSVRVKDGDHDVPLIPDIAGLTTEIAAHLAAGEESPFKVVAGHVPASAPTGPNIEDILSHVRLLKQVVGAGELYGMNASHLGELEAAICSEIHGIVNRQLPSADTPYHKMATWIASANRSVPVTVFTTNYDLLMEQAFEDLGVPYFDGFVGARHPFFDLHAIEEDHLPLRWARLWKIHGSVNWHQGEEGVRRGDTSGDLLVFPSHLKYDQSRRMPYLAMMDQLRAFLKNPGAVLVTCGYSFGDQHINDVIVQGLQGNSSAMVFGLVYGDLDPASAVVSIATRRGNLAVLARNAAVIGRKMDVWEGLPDDTRKDPLPPIEWAADEAGGKSRPQFRLGDFERFGAFLERLSLDYRRSENAWQSN